MLGIDTNILVRHLVQDDPKQAKLATNFILSRQDEGSFFINSIVLCELVWVLESAYEYGRKVIAGVLEIILQTRQFKIENLEAAQRALSAYIENNSDFSDHLIAEVNYSHNCTETVSFDKKFNFTVLIKSLNG
jgi:predicted nucleic-acid-binding protein